MVKRLFLLSLLVLALCGASVVVSFAGGLGGGGQAYMPPPPTIPPLCGPVQTKYSMVKEVITPIPAQLRRVRVVAPYLAGVAWPRKPLAFFANPQTFPASIGTGRYEWLVPIVSEIKNEHFDTVMDPCCKTHKVPRCVWVKANYIRPTCPPACGPPACGPVPMAPPPPMPVKVTK
jgi:hypothetical protein